MSQRRAAAEPTHHILATEAATHVSAVDLLAMLARCSPRAWLPAHAGRCRGSSPTYGWRGRVGGRPHQLAYGSLLM